MSARKAKPDCSPDEAAHQGRLTASATHEFKNVLAIIGETSGLMEDLLDLAGEFPHRERIVELIGRVGQQLERGQRLSTWLNRFAHLPDQRPCVFDPAALTAQLTALAERPARLSRVELRLDECEPGQLETDPIGLHIALFEAMEDIWRRLPEGSVLHVSGEPTAEGYSWLLRAEPNGNGNYEPADEPGEKAARACARAGLTMERAGRDLRLESSAAPRQGD